MFCIHFSTRDDRSYQEISSGGCRWNDTAQVKSGNPGLVFRLLFYSSVDSNLEFFTSGSVHYQNREMGVAWEQYYRKCIIEVYSDVSILLVCWANTRRNY